MTYNIRITEKAEKDIESIYNYISKEYKEPDIAKNTIKSIIDCIESLSLFPFRCPPFRLDDRYRVLFAGSYNIIFEIDTDIINIMGVLPSVIIH